MERTPAVASQEVGPHRRRYSDEDVREILERALMLQGRDFTWEDLEAMASELGVTREQLEAAEDAWFREGRVEAERAAFIAYRRRRALRKLAKMLAMTALVYLAFVSRIAILPAIAIVAAFPLFFNWIGTVDQLFNAFFAVEGESFEKQFDRWLQRRNRRRFPPDERPRLPSD